MKEMVLSYLITTERAIRDMNTGKWTYVDLFSSYVFPEGFPVASLSFVVAGKINNVPAGTLSVEIEVLSPTKKSVDKVHMQGDVIEGDSDITGFFSDVAMSEKGRYTFKITANGKVFQDDSRYYFDVQGGSTND